MSSRVLARFVSRRFSSMGKILSEEEKAAENIYHKKIEKEKLEKLARKGPNPEEKPPTGSVEYGSVSPADVLSAFLVGEFLGFAYVGMVVLSLPKKKLQPSNTR